MVVALLLETIRFKDDNKTSVFGIFIELEKNINRLRIDLGLVFKPESDLGQLDIDLFGLV